MEKATLKRPCIVHKLSVWSSFTKTGESRLKETQRNRIEQPRFAGSCTPLWVYPVWLCCAKRGSGGMKESSRHCRSRFIKVRRCISCGRTLGKPPSLKRLWQFLSSNIRPAGFKSALRLCVITFTFMTLRCENGELQEWNGTRGRKVNLLGMAFFSF